MIQVGAPGNAVVFKDGDRFFLQVTSSNEIPLWPLSDRSLIPVTREQVEALNSSYMGFDTVEEPDDYDPWAGEFITYEAEPMD